MSTLIFHFNQACFQEHARRILIWKHTGEDTTKHIDDIISQKNIYQCRMRQWLRSTVLRKIKSFLLNQFAPGRRIMRLRVKELLVGKEIEKTRRDRNINPKKRTRDKDLIPFKRPGRIVKRTRGEPIFSYFTQKLKKFHTTLFQKADN